jgi:3-hydroxyacyl-[acyl-carrier-protein] dehydratase
MTSKETINALETVDIVKILELLPHRYPFLMIDKIADINGDVSATGIKNVTINEPFFQGHFPDKPVMPGVLLIEAMAQTAGAIVIHARNKDGAAPLVYFMSVDKGRFRQPVVPGDTVHIHVERLQNRGNVWKYKGEAKVEGKVVAEAVVTAMIVDD